MKPWLHSYHAAKRTQLHSLNHGRRPGPYPSIGQGDQTKGQLMSASEVQPSFAADLLPGRNRTLKKPSSWNVTILQSQTTERRKTSINNPTSRSDFLESTSDLKDLRRLLYCVSGSLRRSTVIGCSVTPRKTFTFWASW